MTPVRSSGLRSPAALSVLVLIAVAAVLVPTTRARAVAVDPCRDRAFTFNSSKLSRDYRWRFNASTTPSGIKRRAAERALRRAARHLTRGRNDCGMGLRLGVGARYVGRTRTRPNISSDSRCRRPDGKSVVAFGTLSASDLGLTCYWTRNGHTVEADVVLNRSAYKWVIDPGTSCLGKWAVEAVATHEFGHVFGLDHVGEAGHPTLTMSPLILPCQMAETTLGRGDVRGLRAKY